MGRPEWRLPPGRFGLASPPRAPVARRLPRGRAPAWPPLRRGPLAVAITADSRSRARRSAARSSGSCRGSARPRASGRRAGGTSACPSARADRPRGRRGELRQRSRPRSRLRRVRAGDAGRSRVGAGAGQPRCQPLPRRGVGPRGPGARRTGADRGDRNPGRVPRRAGRLAARRSATLAAAGPISFSLRSVPRFSPEAAERVAGFGLYAACGTVSTPPDDDAD